MIEPVLKGRALLDDIHAAQPQTGEVCVWWLGQSGYAFKTASSLFYTDLYLSEHLTQKYANSDKPHIRMTEAPLRGHDISDATWVFASHKHSDHLDPVAIPELFNASPEARLILPAPIVEYAVSLGLPRERFISTSGDETFHVGDLTVQSIPAAHPTFETTAEGYPFVGYLIAVDGVRIYHSGDTLVYAGLAERIKTFAPDLLLLPINGTSPRLEALNVPPNMNAADAVALAQAIGTGLVIPHHYDMFTFNTADVRDFERLATDAHIPYVVLQPGARFTFRAPH